MSDAVDLDRYREPSRDPAVLEARRLALVDQLGWLADEAAALGPLLASLPPWAVDQSPVAEEKTVKETLQALAALDRDVYPGWLDQLDASGDDAPAFDVPDLAALGDGANDRDLHDLLADVRAQREPLATRIASIAPEAWDRKLTLGEETMDLYGLALDIVRRDADELKTLAYRLHSADISQRTRG